MSDSFGELVVENVISILRIIEIDTAILFDIHCLGEFESATWNIIGVNKPYCTSGRKLAWSVAVKDCDIVGFVGVIFCWFDSSNVDIRECFQTEVDITISFCDKKNACFRSNIIVVFDEGVVIN